VSVGALARAVEADVRATNVSDAGIAGVDFGCGSELSAKGEEDSELGPSCASLASDDGPPGAVVAPRSAARLLMHRSAEACPML